RVPIRNNQLVKKGDLLFEIDPRTFQDQVNFASAQLANMQDIVKSLAQQVQGMRDAITQSESAVKEAQFEMESYAAKAQNAKVQFEGAAALLKAGTGDLREYDNRNTAYLMALAQLNGARSAVNRATAELEHSRADLARGIADLGVLGEDNPRIRRAAAGPKVGPQNPAFTKGVAPQEGYVTNPQTGGGGSPGTDPPIRGDLQGRNLSRAAL